MEIPMTIPESLAAAVSLHQKGDLDEAEKRYVSILEKEPHCADAVHLLGILLRQRGKTAEALSLLEKACSLSPANRQFLLDCADCLRENKIFDKAFDRYQRALATAPEDVSVLLKVAGFHHAMGSLEESCKVLHRVLQLKPDHIEALLDYAELLRLRGTNEEALSCVARALTLKPDSSVGHNTAGLIYEALGNPEKAKQHFQEAVRLNDGFAEALINLGNVLRAKGEIQSAIESYRRALSVKPDFFEAYYNLGNCLRDTDALDEALLCFKAALRLRPTSIQALSNYGEALQTVGRIQEAETHYTTAVELSQGKCAQAYSNLLLCMNYNPEHSPRRLYEKHLEFGLLFNKVSQTPDPAELDKSLYAGNSYAKSIAISAIVSKKRRNSHKTPKKIHIGYVSPDFCNHPVCRFIEPVLVCHDKREFEIFCYSDVAIPDAVTERLKKAHLHWRDVKNQEDNYLENAIRNDAIDILVDCAGHTAGNRLPVFAKKPAPLQISYVGYPTTTGLAAMDYYIADAIVDPVEDASMYTEKLLRMEPCFCNYMPIDNAPFVNDLPAAKNGFVTFGSLHPLARLNDQVIHLWAMILKDVPLSRLRIIRNTLVGAARKKLETQFHHHALDPKRIDLINEIPAAGHLSLYYGIDISLDTFPWSGHTTACESLWMGVPVVTLYGNRHAGRMVSSILKTMGLADWVAPSREEYRAIAIKKASSIDGSRSLRRRLRDMMAASDVCNSTKFTRKLEAAFKKILVV